MKRRLSRYFLVVIENQNEGRAQSPEQRAEVAPCEGREIRVVLGGEKR